MTKKGVFAEQLDDIDDLMPQRPAVPAGDEAAAMNSDDDTDSDYLSRAAEDDLSAPLAGDASQQRTVRSRRSRVAVSVPTAEVAPQIHRLLRQLTTKERSRDPISARTYAQVVLDAIEAHQEQLATYWRTEAISEPTGGGGLFSRRPATSSRRRRHAQPPARIPLTGLNQADGKVLDGLVAKWNAPSRSALVEQALRFYFKAD